MNNTHLPGSTSKSYVCCRMCDAQMPRNCSNKCDKCMNTCIGSRIEGRNNSDRNENKQNNAQQLGGTEIIHSLVNERE